MIKFGKYIAYGLWSLEKQVPDGQSGFPVGQNKFTVGQNGLRVGQFRREPTGIVRSVIGRRVSGRARFCDGLPPRLGVNSLWR